MNWNDCWDYKFGFVEVMRSAQTWTDADTGSLLTGSCIWTRMHSPTGRMSMKTGGRNANVHDE